MTKQTSVETGQDDPIPLWMLGDFKQARKAYGIGVDRARRQPSVSSCPRLGRFPALGVRAWGFAGEQMRASLSLVLSRGNP